MDSRVRPERSKGSQKEFGYQTRNEDISNFFIENSKIDQI